MLTNSFVAMVSVKCRYLALSMGAISSNVHRMAALVPYLVGPVPEAFR